jgi:uncharacterized membrane protein
MDLYRRTTMQHVAVQITFLGKLQVRGCVTGPMPRFCGPDQLAKGNVIFFKGVQPSVLPNRWLGLGSLHSTTSRAGSHGARTLAVWFQEGTENHRMPSVNRRISFCATRTR